MTCIPDVAVYQLWSHSGANSGATTLEPHIYQLLLCVMEETIEITK
jgi:hypothetical protein